MLSSIFFLILFVIFFIVDFRSYRNKRKTSSLFWMGFEVATILSIIGDLFFK